MDQKNNIRFFANQENKTFNNSAEDGEYKLPEKL